MTAPGGGAPVIAVLGTRYPDLAIEAEILGVAEGDLRAGAGSSPEEILAVAGDADVVLAGSGPKFTADVIAALACRAIVRYGVGTESVDLDAARAAGMWVARVADYGTEAVATHAVTLALAAARRVPAAHAGVLSGRWQVASLGPLHLPSASTVGLLGFGRIGRHAARQFAGLGYAVIAHDPMVPVAGQIDGVEEVSFADLLARSDILSLHLPGNPDGRPVLDADAISRLKPGSVVVNTARGSLIDLAALSAGLRRGVPAFAALDVLPVEPPSDLSVFEELSDRVLLTPHMAWYSVESQEDLRRKAARAALAVLRGETPPDWVVRPGDTDDVEKVAR